MIDAKSPPNAPPIELCGPPGLRLYIRAALSLSRTELARGYYVTELVGCPRPGEHFRESRAARLRVCAPFSPLLTCHSAACVFWRSTPQAKSAGAPTTLRRRRAAWKRPRRPLASSRRGRRPIPRSARNSGWTSPSTEPPGKASRAPVPTSSRRPSITLRSPASPSPTGSPPPSARCSPRSSTSDAKVRPSRHSKSAHCPAAG